MAWLIEKNYTYYGPTSEIIDNPGNTPLLNFVGASSFLPVPPPPVLPVRARQTEPYKRGLSDMFVVAGPVAVSERFRLLVEEFEPGVHWFAPLIIERKNGKVVEGQYWFFHVQQDLDCLITDNDPAAFEHLWTDENGTKQILCRLTQPGRSVAISRRAIREKHLWTSGLLGLTKLFCSDAFRTAVREARLKGISFDRQCDEVDKSWVAEEQMGPLLPRWKAYVESGRTLVDYKLGDMTGYEA